MSKCSYMQFKLCLQLTASSPVARDDFLGDNWVIIKESGDEGSDGNRGEKHSPLVLYAHSLHQLSRASRLSPAFTNRVFPTEPWETLWRRQCNITNVFVRVRGGGKPGCEGVRIW